MSTWNLHILKPKYCVWLSLEESVEPEVWSRTEAHRLLGPPSTDEQRKIFAETLCEGTADARERTPILAGLLFYPDFTRIPPIARIEVQAFYPKSPYEPVTLNLFRDTLGKPGKHTLGDIQENELTLPAGPALRFAEKYEVKARAIGPWYEAWRIVYAVRPEAIQDGAWLSVSWIEPAFSDTLAKVAEAIANSLEFEPKAA